PTIASVLDGLSTDVPITVTRINGSAGPLQMSVSGLPQGVTAAVSPNPIPTGITSATLHLTAASDAPRVDQLADVVVTGDPLANANVAVGLRTTHVGLRVASPYDLRQATPGSVPVNACSDTDVPIVVARDSAFGGTVGLSVHGLPAGVTADILPDATVVPGGGFYADRTVRFHAAAGAALPATVQIVGTSAGMPDRTLALVLTNAAATASVHDPVVVAKTPQHLQPGSTVTLDGNGFCRGSTVAVGNTAASAPTTVAPDGKSLTFETPRTASSGPVTVFPPAGAGSPFATSNGLTVDDFRNTVGFQFHNPSYGWLSYSELTSAFGSEDMWITVNPCWPWGSCRINTGIPDPLSYAEWGVLNVALHASGGHCFGITVATEKIRLGKVSAASLGGVAHGNGFSLPAAGGPNSTLSDYLDGQHALQGSAEFLSAYAHRDRNASGQLGTLHSELALNHDPIVTMHHPGGVFGEGHAVLAYDEQAVSGGTDIYVYDNNRPSPAAGDAAGTTSSVIHVRGNSWSLTMADGTVWSGQDGDGSLFITPQSTIPDNPSLPSLGSLADLPSLIFGATDGAATVTGATPDATPLPVLDSAAAANTAGWLIGKTPGSTITDTITGAKNGTYDAAVSGSGFAGVVSGVSTKPGVVDQAGGNAQGNGLTFASGQDRPLTMTVATVPDTGKAARMDDGPAAGPASAQTATIQTHVDKGGKDAAGITAGGTLSYQHQGDPTTFSFTLTDIDQNAGPQRFVSPAIPIAGGDKVTASPIGSAMSAVAVTIRGKSGKTKRITVKNKAKAPAKLSLKALHAPGGKGGKDATVTASVGTLAPDTTGVLGVVVRVMRGKHAVATHTVSKSITAAGAVPVSWAVPAVKKGSYHLVVDARLSVGGTAGGTVTAHTSVAYRAR
ncbi:MAG: hypothetical protein AAGC46_04180, partial [Solirubrobacteraceae bacterium]